MDKLLGVDVSKWQGKMDWNKCRSAGSNYAFIRAGSINNSTGECYTDYQFEVNQAAAELMPIGFYWYFRPNHDPIKQANYFCDLIKDKKRKLKAVLDWETTGGLSPPQNTDRAAMFVLRINELLGALPILYSRAYWLNKNTITDDFMMLLNLWIARYTFKSKPWGNLLPYPDLPGIKPRDYNSWTFWQWSAGGNGRGPEFGASSKSIDLDYFNGDQIAFNEYIGEPLPDPYPDDIGIKADIGGVKYRGRIDRVE
ncbi:MAG: glycoside hydrolase family 25 protein [Chloroflexi bacterium]|nr:glycoside hydrolase family 25 protein [Chloroflexota bacterium]